MRHRLPNSVEGTGASKQGSRSAGCGVGDMDAVDGHDREGRDRHETQLRLR